jgi:hypothetical protein
MGDFEFDKQNINFYSNDNPAYPDEIDITVIHDDYNENNKTTLPNGVYIFLDNYLGELTFATTIDSISIIGKGDAEKELVPIEKLKSFLVWREKEFIEKYEGTRHQTDGDMYASLTADLKNGGKLFAIINTDILNWEAKASHPWILDIEIGYNGKETNGMPDDDTWKFLEEIETRISEKLKDSDGYINVGRQTAESTRNIYFACKDFRKPSIVLHQIQTDFSKKIAISYNIYKDKYWQSFERFNPN